MGFWDIFLGALFLIVCFLLIVIVLLQKGKGGGLGAAFGGMGSSAFGTRTGDVFTWVTIVLTGLFLVLAVVTSLAFRPAPGIVFAPKFLPPPGPLSEPTSIEITCETGGSTIYYTIDGGPPDQDSVAYDRAIRIEPPVVIRAIAYRGNWKPSPVSEGRYPKRTDANQPATAPGLMPPGPGPDTAPAPTPPPTPAPAPATAPAATRPTGAATN